MEGESMMEEADRNSLTSEVERNMLLAKTVEDSYGLDAGVTGDNEPVSPGRGCGVSRRGKRIVDDEDYV